MRKILANPAKARHSSGLVRTSAAARKPESGSAFRGDEFVRGAGEILHFAKETEANPVKIDHFWITIRAGAFGPLRISINTWSLKHAADGFDPRMRVGLLGFAWAELPASGLFPAKGLDYAQLEGMNPIVYREMDRPALEQFLMGRAERSIFAEAWGSFYRRNQLGIHQVHSRRASCSVAADHVGRDGALRLYYREESVSEMLLFKYCGQV